MTLRLRDRYGFLWQSVEVFNVFNTLSLQQIFWKTYILFKKQECHYLVRSTKIENATFSYKTALRVQNRPITKNGVLPVTILFFRKFCFGMKTSYKKLIWWTNPPNDQIFILFASVGVSFEGAFFLWVSWKY